MGTVNLYDNGTTSTSDYHLLLFGHKTEPTDGDPYIKFTKQRVDTPLRWNLYPSYHWDPNGKGRILPLIWIKPYFCIHL